MAPTQTSPLAYSFLLGTASAQILPFNPTRRGIMFYNPGPNTVAVCPAVNNTGGANAAAISGAGSLTILPMNVLVIPPVPWVDAACSVAWNGVASGANTPFTAFEF